MPIGSFRAAASDRTDHGCSMPSDVAEPLSGDISATSFSPVQQERGRWPCSITDPSGNQAQPCTGHQGHTSGGSEATGSPPGSLSWQHGPTGVRTSLDQVAQASGTLEEIGVQLFVPYCRSVNLEIHTRRSTGVVGLCTAVYDSPERPFPEHDCIVALRPQQFLGLMDVISYHSCLDFLPTPHKAVVLDLSRVGGHCHATILPTRMTWEDLAYKVHRLLNVDIFEDPVGIWQGETLEPVMRNSTIVLQHGDTLVFMLSEYGPPRGFKADDFFNQDTRWYGFQHLLSCRNTKHIAVCTTSELFPIDPHYFQHLPDQELALHVTELEGASHRVTEVDMAPTLELDRKSCSKLRTVTETVIDSGNPDAQIEANYLLDLRPLCQCPKLVTFRNAWPDLPEILNVADITFPPGQCGDLLQNRVFGTVQVLRIGVAPALADLVFRTMPLSPGFAREPETEDLVTVSAPHRPHSSGASSGASPGPVTNVAAPAPARFERERASPSPRRMLDLDDITDDEVPDTEPTPFWAGVHVMMPDLQDELLRVSLVAPCDVDHALSVISDARDTIAAIHHNVLVPAHPQPDPSFACVLALPPWTTNGSFVVADLRAIDGRLFMHPCAERLNRSSLLLQFEVVDLPGLQVYLADQRLDHVTWYELPLGTTITVLPPDFGFLPGHSLEMMLHSKEIGAGLTLARLLEVWRVPPFCFCRTATAKCCAPGMLRPLPQHFSNKSLLDSSDIKTTKLLSVRQYRQCLMLHGVASIAIWCLQPPRPSIGHLFLRVSYRNAST